MNSRAAPRIEFAYPRSPVSTSIHDVPSLTRYTFTIIVRRNSTSSAMRRGFELMGASRLFSLLVEPADGSALSLSRGLALSLSKGRRVVARQPSTQTVQARKQNALVDIRLIEFVANLPF